MNNAQQQLVTYSDVGELVGSQNKYITTTGQAWALVGKVVSDHLAIYAVMN